MHSTQATSNNFVFVVLRMCSEKRGGSLTFLDPIMCTHTTRLKIRLSAKTSFIEDDRKGSSSGTYH